MLCSKKKEAKYVYEYREVSSFLTVFLAPKLKPKYDEYESERFVGSLNREIDAHELLDIK